MGVAVGRGLKAIERSGPVADAIQLPACPDCRAAKGDPCRTPGDRTRKPHAGRLRVAQIDGTRKVTPALAQCARCGRPESPTCCARAPRPVR